MFNDVLMERGARLKDQREALDSDFSLSDAKAVLARVERKETQRKKLRSSYDSPVEIPADDELATKQNIAELKAKLQDLDDKIQLILDVISFDQFMKQLQNPENTEAAKDLFADLVSEGVTADPEQHLMNCIAELQAKLSLAATWLTAKEGPGD